MAPRDPRRRHSIEHPPRPLPKRDADDVDVLDRPSSPQGFDEPSRERGGFDPNVNSVPRR
jgi:hypothetical protein